MKTKGLLLIIGLLTLGISTRFMFIVDGQSMLPNFTALGAIAIFGSNYLKGSMRFVIPFVILWLSDLVLNNVIYSQYYESFQFFGSPWVYSAFLLAILIGIAMMRKPSWSNLFFTAIGTGVVFYLVTNFAVWMSPSSPYLKNAAGLLDCYLAALPFFRNTLLGNVFYSFLLFASFEFFVSRYASFTKGRILSEV